MAGTQQWTNEEIHTLYAGAHMGAKKLSQILDRSVRSIQKMAQEMDIGIDLDGSGSEPVKASRPVKKREPYVIERVKRTAPPPALVRPPAKYSGNCYLNLIEKYG